MKISILSALFSIFLFQSCKETSSQNLEIDNNGIYDFNSIIIGDTVKHTFTISNNSDHQVTIEGIQPICACTVTKISSRVIQSDGEVKLEATYVSRKNEVGEVKKIVAVRTDGPQKLILLCLQGQVIASRPTDKL